MTMYDYDGPTTKIQLYLRQLLAASAPLLGISASGMSGGYSAILLPQLKSVASNDSDFFPPDFADDHLLGPLSIEQESWIAAAAVLPMAPGCWTGGFMAERFGRKTSMLRLFPVFFVGWLIIGLADSMETLVAGRLLVGYCVGILAPIVPIYLSETSDPLLRGILLTAITLTLSIGILACHAMGTWLHWRTTAYVCSAVSLLCWVISLFLRESPTWLLGRGELERARRSWIFLRGVHSLEEFSSLLGSTRPVSSKRSLLRSLRGTYFLKPFAICCLYFFTTQFAGSNVMIFYCVEILWSLLGSSNVSERTNGYLISLVIDAIRLTFGVISCLLMKSTNRRAMTFLSGFGVAVSMLSLSLCLTFDIGRPWLPTMLLFVYIALLSLGLMPLPWLLCGELFAPNFRELGSGLTSGYGFLCFFVVIKMTPAMMELIRPQGAFAVFGCVALAGTSILYFILPETKNKTLQEIQTTFGGKPHALTIQNADISILNCDLVEEHERKVPDKCDDCLI